MSSLLSNLHQGLTVFFGLEGDLSALLLPLRVGQGQTDVNAVVGWQITEREARGIVLYSQALAYGGVVASASPGHCVAVAEGH